MTYEDFEYNACAIWDFCCVFSSFLSLKTQPLWIVPAWEKSNSSTVLSTVLGKLLLKVMHYNIALLPKKVTNYVT